MKAILFIFFVLIMSSADIFLAKKGILPVDPSVMIAGVSLLFGAFFIGNSRFRTILQSESGNNFSRRNWFFIFYAITSILFVLHPDAYLSKGFTFVLLPSLNLLLIYFTIFCALYFDKEFFKRIFITAFIASATSILIEVFFPGIFSKVASRGAGFAVNPNSSGLRIMLMTAALFFFEYKKAARSHFIILATAGISVLFTFSRGALVIYLLFLMFVLYNNYKKNIKSILIGIIALASIAMVLEFAGLSISKLPIFNSNGARSRLSMVTGQSQFVNSEDGRVLIAYKYYESIMESPFFGHGIGSSNDHIEMGLAPHNVYLKIWYEQGIIIFAMYLIFLFSAIISLMKKKKYDFASLFLVIMIGGFFTHNLLDNRTMIVIISFYFVYANKIIKSGQNNTIYEQD